GRASVVEDEQLGSASALPRDIREDAGASDGHDEKSASTAVHSSPMAACPRCDSENPEAARFCAACGSPLAPSAAMPLETRKTVTVLFCDVTGSTTLGEQPDPEQDRRVPSRAFEVPR